MPSRGGIKGDEVALAQRRMELTLQREAVQRALELARQRVQELSRLVAVGVVSELDLRRAEVALLERNVELQRISEELRMIGAVKQ